MRVLFFVAVLIIGFCQFSRAQLVTYPAPQGSVLNKDYEVFVREKDGKWQPVATYMAQVANVVGTATITEKSSFCYFDFEGEVEVRVNVLKGQIKQARVRPAANALNAVTEKNTYSFVLKEAANLSVEINGDIFHNLHLFANPLETFKPSKDKKVLYYGPGIHQVGDVVLASGQTVFIAGGSIVQGRFIVSHAQNVTITGHGILSQLPTLKPLAADQKPLADKRYAKGRTDAITVEFSKNINISGIVVLPHKYTVIMGESKDVTIDNIKSFSFEGNGDGLDIFCSADVKINRVFMRNSDDCIAIYGHRWDYYGNVKNITVQNSILWADVAHPILIGTHGDSVHPDTISNITFQNIDILDQHENQIDYQGCLALNAGDDNLIQNINFNRIRVDNIRKGQLVNLRVMFNHKYNTSAGRGIENVLFKEISYIGNNADISIIAGYDESRKIKNIVFENLSVNGRLISDTMPGKPGFYKTSDMSKMYIGEHVEGVKFIQVAKDEAAKIDE